MYKLIDLGKIDLLVDFLSNICRKKVSQKQQKSSIAPSNEDAPYKLRSKYLWSHIWIFTLLIPRKNFCNLYLEWKYLVKFIYSEKATKFCEISTLLLSECTVGKSKLEPSQNFVAFSEYKNFIEFNLVMYMILKCNLIKDMKSFWFQLFKSMH